MVAAVPTLEEFEALEREIELIKGALFTLKMGQCCGCDEWFKDALTSLGGELWCPSHVWMGYAKYHEAADAKVLAAAIARGRVKLHPTTTSERRWDGEGEPPLHRRLRSWMNLVDVPAEGQQLLLDAVDRAYSR